LASNVAIDFSGPYRAAIDTLVARGADRIAFLCPEEEWTVNLHNKFRFARQQMAARGCTDGSPASGYFSTAATVVEELREGMPLAAVLCANDLVANDLLCALWAVGIQPGRDMVVVGCDGTVPRPGMWTIPVDLDEVAAAAVELLLAGMNEAQDLREVTVCPPLQTA
jgi:LacI family transcriptional regulator